MMQSDKIVKKPIGGYLQALLDACPNAVLAVDSNGIIQFANKAATELLECEMKDLIGRNIVNYYESEERAKDVNRNLYAHGGVIKEFESVSRTKNGKLVTIRISGSHLKDHTGNVTGSVGYFEVYRPWTEAEIKVRDYCKDLESKVCLLADTNLPIFDVWPGISAVVLGGKVDSYTMARIRENLMTHVMKVKSRVAVIDISKADIEDEETISELMKAVRLIKIIGIQCYVAGISLELAQTLERRKVDLSQLKTFASLHIAFEAALESIGLEIGAHKR